MARGKLIGLGVGPGDPDLLTVRGVRVLERVRVIAFIAAAGRSSRAREIAAPHLRAGTRELIAVMPMSGDAEATGRAYAQLVTGIVGELGQGHDVAFLCEGDPLLYGSFAQLLGRLGDRFECEVVPGITSMTAAAAATALPLASGDDPLLILPATLPPQRLEMHLRDVDRVVILKVGRHLPKVREALVRAEFTENAVLVENVTTGSERIRPLATVTEPQVPYFSLVLGSRRREDR